MPEPQPRPHPGRAGLTESVRSSWSAELLREFLYVASVVGGFVVMVPWMMPPWASAAYTRALTAVGGLVVAAVCVAACLLDRFKNDAGVVSPPVVPEAKPQAGTAHPTVTRQ
jgi:hypothetical protein